MTHEILTSYIPPVDKEIEKFNRQLDWLYTATVYMQSQNIKIQLFFMPTDEGSCERMIDDDGNIANHTDREINIINKMFRKALESDIIDHRKPGPHIIKPFIATNTIRFINRYACPDCPEKHFEVLLKDKAREAKNKCNYELKEFLKCEIKSTNPGLADIFTTIEIIPVVKQWLEYLEEIYKTL